MEDFIDLICILFVLILVFGFLTSIFENSIEFDSYFLKHFVLKIDKKYIKIYKNR